METQPSPSEQLDRLAADREALRTRARYPLWYCALWGLAVTWWGLIAVVPGDARLWFGLIQWLFFAVLFYAQSRRRVKVPRPPWKWPTVREWVLLLPTIIGYNAILWFGYTHDHRWLVTASTVVMAVIATVVFYRDQQIVFRDER